MPPPSTLRAPLLLAAAASQEIFLVPRDAVGQLQARYWSNANFLSRPTCEVLQPPSLNASRDSDLPCASLDLVAVRWDGSVTPPQGHRYRMAVRSNGPVRVFVNDWRLLDGQGNGELGGPEREASLREAVESFNGTGSALPLRLEFLSAQRFTASFQLLWYIDDASEPVPVDSSALSSTVSEPETKRQALQQGLARGWNTWYRKNAMAHLHLPTVFGVALTIVDRISGESYTGGIVDKCAAGDASGCRVRPGAHAYNGSYTHLTQKLELGVNGTSATIESAHGDDEGDILALRVLVSPASAASRYLLLVDGSLNWPFTNCWNGTEAAGYCGAYGADDNGTLWATPTGLPAVAASVALPTSGTKWASDNRVIASFDDAGVARAAVKLGDAGTSASFLPSVDGAVAARRASFEKALDARYAVEKVGQDMREGVEALRAVVGWNTVYNPAVGVITPVSRDFGPQPWALWLWDTFFLALLAGESDRELAYANLFEVARTTVMGNVPGFRFGSTLHQPADRSKPYVGPMVILELYRKFGDKWMVELLFPKMLDWANWVHAKRVQAPEGLVVLGSDSVPDGWSDGHQCSVTAAKWESGLDNSPMYDDKEQWDPETCRLKLYDVGMTGLYMNMLESLETLAGVVGRGLDAALLRSRREAIAAATNRVLWNESMGIYANVRSDTGASSPEVSPFNFHPMLSGAASEEQASAMIERWLRPSSGFCLDDVSSSQAACNYPLPSIAASSPSYGGDYWRGRVWGPMNYLVYMGLRHPAYRGLEAAKAARKTLARRSLDLLLVSWRLKGHVYENVDSATGFGDNEQNANPFYHWGALLALIGLQEGGHY